MEILAYIGAGTVFVFCLLVIGWMGGVVKVSYEKRK